MIVYRWLTKVKQQTGDMHDMHAVKSHDFPWNNSRVFPVHHDTPPYIPVILVVW